MENGWNQPWEELEQDVDHQNHPQSSPVRVISSMELKWSEAAGGAWIGCRPKSASIEPDANDAFLHFVREEVQLLVCDPNPLYGNRQYYIEEAVPTPQSQPSQSRGKVTHKLVFANQVPQTIYTGNNITENDKMPIEIQLIDINTGNVICTNKEGSPIKVKIVKARDGKRPLLVGNTELTLNQGVGIIGDTYFTDNSKWLRSGKFRHGACIDSERCGTAIKTQEGLSEKFTVKDHREELYNKHYPPMPNDDVWRLEKIAKDANFHQRLKNNNINIVQDFLKLLKANPSELKEMLKIPTNAWNKVVKHAQTCPTELNNADLRTYGNGAESEAGVPIIYSSFSPYLVGSPPNVGFWNWSHDI